MKVKKNHNKVQRFQFCFLTIQVNNISNVFEPIWHLCLELGCGRKLGYDDPL